MPLGTVHRSIHPLTNNTMQSSPITPPSPTCLSQAPITLPPLLASHSSPPIHTLPPIHSPSLTTNSSQLTPIVFRLIPTQAPTTSLQQQSSQTSRRTRSPSHISLNPPQPTPIPPSPPPCIPPPSPQRTPALPNTVNQPVSLNPHLHLSLQIPSQLTPQLNS